MVGKLALFAFEKDSLSYSRAKQISKEKCLLYTGLYRQTNETICLRGGIMLSKVTNSSA
jgi:hypothetical protein